MDFEAIAARNALVARESTAENLRGGEIVRLPVQLPFWPEPERAAPTALMRSSLFGVRKSSRSYVKGETLVVWPGSSIVYTGERLDQFDLDVWLTAVHLSRLQDLSDAHGVQFTKRGFVKSLGRTWSGSRMMELVSESFRRMMACAVEIKIGPETYAGNLIQEWILNDDTGRYILRLNPRLKNLFDTGYTRLDWEIRKTLPSGLTQWLQAYICTQKATAKHPHRILLVRIRDLCGSDRKEIRKFKADVSASMKKLEDERVVGSWRITDGDALEFSRPKN